MEYDDTYIIDTPSYMHVTIETPYVGVASNCGPHQSSNI